ncbi:hypothetical protein [Methanohalobium sp.]|uniref:hypothetical protein n=1 Tax=Methanohalobium sp. TaxID=2837493 RepID=UPI0025EC7C26|nr:hypothetical protein [Methanohalobium sp.]
MSDKCPKCDEIGVIPRFAVTEFNTLRKNDGFKVRLCSNKSCSIRAYNNDENKYVAENNHPSLDDIMFYYEMDYDVLEFQANNTRI